MEHLIIPQWPVPPNVHALQTTRNGGVSIAPYDSLNLSVGGHDSLEAVTRNRELLSSLLPNPPIWLREVHGTEVIEAGRAEPSPKADASFTRSRGTVCAILTADCLPVLLCDEAGTVVAGAHAGWRGMAAGVIEATVRAMGVASEHLLVWLGPAISSRGFEVGADVRDAFMAQSPQASLAFTPKPLTPDKWMADLYLLARQRLEALGVSRIYGGEYCTYSDPTRFFSYRREHPTGNMAALIWLE